MTLIPASVVHGAVMAAIHEEAFPVGERWGADAMALQLGLPGAFGLMAGPDGFVLARVAADEAEILTLAVVPGQRRRGLASSLLRAALAQATAAGAIAMLLEVAVDNQAALALYARLGFVEVGRRRNYYRTGVDALVLRCALPTDMPAAISPA